MIIGQTGRITFLIFALTVTSGSLITGLLLAMWMRSRKTEIAVLISLGIAKGNILSQMILEEMILYLSHSREQELQQSSYCRSSVIVLLSCRGTAWRWNYHLAGS